MGCASDHALQARATYQLSSSRGCIPRLVAILARCRGLGRGLGWVLGLLSFVRSPTHPAGLHA